MIPLFTSHYSLGKSILTLDDPENIELNNKEKLKKNLNPDSGPDSIIKICLDNGLKDCYLVENNMSGFVSAYKMCSKHNLHLVFGLRLNICSDMTDKSEESLKTEHQLIVFMKNTNGYQALSRIYSKASTDGFYYIPRIDIKTLQALWTEDLLLTVPFYDSFIFNNCLKLNSIFVDISWFKSPVFFLEENNHPYDETIRKRLLEYCKNNDYDIQETKSIYYKNRKDFEAFLTFKCVFKHKSFAMPKIDALCSPEFSFESYQNKISHGRK